MTEFVENVPWIDPQLIRLSEQKRESYSLFTALFQLGADCSNVPKSEMHSGGDVSQWQGKMDWDKYFDNGMKYTIIRAMINGRVDDQYDRNSGILVAQNRDFLVYGATGYPTLANAIPYARALADIVKGVPYLGIWWDSELSGLLNPQEMAIYNSELLGELSVLLPGSILEIYTRQTFWDSSVAAGNWKKYPLAAARYNEQLTCPWSDGRFTFRDWDDWRYWQDSQWWDGDKFGAESRCIDHLYFNGNGSMFNDVYKPKPPIEPPVEIPIKPCTWDFEVISDKLNYRTEPIVSVSTQVGYFRKGHVIEAIKLTNPRLGDFWLQFRMEGNLYYAALVYSRTQHCRPIE